MKKIQFKYLSIVLLVAFINAIAPKVVLHSFHHHQETNDCTHSDFEIEIQHSHCSFLHLELPSFKDSIQHKLIVLVSDRTYHFIGFINTLSYSEYSIIKLRGPPTIIA